MTKSRKTGDLVNAIVVDTANNITVPNSLTVTGSLEGLGGITGSLFGTASQALTASYAFYAVSASHEIIKEVSSSFADTASYVNPLNQDVEITGSLQVTGSVTASNLLVTGDFQNYNPDIPDIGIEQVNAIRGYGDDYIAEKTLAYTRVGSSAFDEEGAIRVKNNTYQVYLSGSWQDIGTGFRFRPDSNNNYELEYRPTGFSLYIEVNSGNSNQLGLNGLPLVQNYAISMGPYPVPLELDGGTF